MVEPEATCTPWNSPAVGVARAMLLATIEDPPIVTESTFVLSSSTDFTLTIPPNALFASAVA